MQGFDATTHNIADRVRRIADPDKIILFGSRARGDSTEESDYDILVVAPSSLPRWKRTVPLYDALAGTGVAKDIVWWTPEEIDEWKNVRSHFISTVLREGKVLYEKPA